MMKVVQRIKANLCDLRIFSLCNQPYYFFRDEKKISLWLRNKRTEPTLGNKVMCFITSFKFEIDRTIFAWKFSTLFSNIFFKLKFNSIWNNFDFTKYFKNNVETEYAYFMNEHFKNETGHNLHIHSKVLKWFIQDYWNISNWRNCIPEL